MKTILSNVAVANIVFTRGINYIAVKAPTANTGNVFISYDGTPSATNGFLVEPGDFMMLPVEQYTKLMAIAATDEDEIYVMEI